MVTCDFPNPCPKAAVQFLIPHDDIADIMPPCAYCDTHRDRHVGEPKTLWKKGDYTEEDYQVAYVRHIMES
jgi:hypothetical protein